MNKSDDETVFIENTGNTKIIGGNPIPLYTHPAKNLSLQKVDGELIAVTYTDDEHRIVEVLWEKPPAKTLTSQEIRQTAVECGAYINEDTGSLYPDDMCVGSFARAILRKAQEK